MNGAESGSLAAIQHSLALGDRAAGKRIPKLVGVHTRHVHHRTELRVHGEGHCDHRDEGEYGRAARRLRLRCHARGW